MGNQQSLLASAARAEQNRTEQDDVQNGKLHLEESAGLAPHRSSNHDNKTSSLPSIKSEMQQSAPLAQYGLPSLDELLGKDRDAIRYKDELEAKTAYLQKKVHEQANETERLLHQAPEKAAKMRGSNVSHIYGPPPSRSKAFGSAADSKPLAHRWSSSSGGMNFKTNAAVAVSTREPRVSAPGLSSQVQQGMRGRGAVPVSKVGRPVSVMDKRRTATTSGVNKHMNQGPSWRQKVARVQNKLYWFLKAYMAFSSVLKRSRKGVYAEMLTADVLPMHLANRLMGDAEAFGEYLAVLAAARDTDRAGGGASLLYAKQAGSMWAHHAAAMQGGRSNSAPEAELVAEAAHAIQEGVEAGVEGGADDTGSVSPRFPVDNGVLTGDSGAQGPVQNHVSPQVNARLHMLPHPPLGAPAPLPPTTGVGRRPRATWSGDEGGGSLPVPIQRPGTSLLEQRSGRLESGSGSGLQPARPVGRLRVNRPMAARWSVTGAELAVNGSADGSAGAQRASRGSLDGTAPRLTANSTSYMNPYLGSALQHAAVGSSAARLSREARKAVREVEQSQIVAQMQVEVVAGDLRRAAQAPKAEAVLEAMARTAATNAQLLANNANSKWCEGLRWHPPMLHSVNSLSEVTDMKMYTQVVPQLFERGEVCVMLVYGGEGQVIGLDNGGHEQSEAALGVDLWYAISRLYPHKVPSGSTRIQGLPWLARRILQVIADVEGAAGVTAVKRLRLVLAVDAPHTEAVIAMILGFAHFGLQPEQLIISSIARMPGMRFDEASNTFKVMFDLSEDYASAGAGFALMSLMWPSRAFALTSDGERHYVPGTVLAWLSRHKVNYIHASLVADPDAVLGCAAVTDPAFLAPAVYLFDHKGAGMAMEVVQGTTERTARYGGAVIMAADAHATHSVALHVNDLQSPRMAAVLMAAQRRASVVAPVGRYLFTVGALSGLLARGPHAFRPDVVLHPSGRAHLSFDWGDLSAWAEARAVAVLGKGQPGFDMRTSNITREFLHDVAPAALLNQDNNAVFRARVMRTLQEAGLGPPDSAARKVHVTVERTGSGFKCMLLVADNDASRAAFRVARALMRYANDKLVLVHCLAGGQSGSDANAKELLASFKDPLLEAQIERRVVVSSERLLMALVSEVEASKPDLVMAGSQVLTMHGGSPEPVMGSMCIALARMITGVPLCIAKGSGVDVLLGADDLPGDRPPLCVAAEVSASSGPLLAWTLDRLDQHKDYVHLVKLYGVDRAAQRSQTVTTIMRRALDTATAAKFDARAHALESGYTESLPPLVQQVKADVLVLQAPSGRSLPASHQQVLHTARCAVLLYRVRNQSWCDGCDSLPCMGEQACC